MGEIDLCIDIPLSGTHPGPDPADRLDNTLAADSVSQLGNLWQFNRHRVLCGNACQAGDYAVLLANGPAQVVFTDPPYNVPINGQRRK